MAMGLTQPLTETSTRRPVRTADNLTTFMCRLSWNLGASSSWNAQDLSRLVMGLHYLSLNIKSKLCPNPKMVHTYHFAPHCWRPLVLRYCLDFKLTIFCASWWALLAWQCWGTRTPPPKRIQRIPGASPYVALLLQPKWGLWWQCMVSLQPLPICCTDVHYAYVFLP